MANALRAATDARAARMAGSLLPEGTRLGRGVRAGAAEVGERVSVPVAGRLVGVPGTRSTTTPLVRRGRQVGEVKAQTAGRRVFVDHMELERQARGKGVGRNALAALERNAPRSEEVSRANFLAFGDSSRGRGGMSGARAWRQGGAKYAVGGGLQPRLDATVAESLKGLSPGQRRAARRYIRRSRVRGVSPSELRSNPEGLDPQAAKVLQRSPWVASVRGGAPRTGRRLAAAGAGGYAIGAGRQR